MAIGFIDPRAILSSKQAAPDPGATRATTTPIVPADQAGQAPTFSAVNFSLSIQIHLERTTMSAAGQALGRTQADVKLDLRFTAVDALLEHFSPENTANRIADFVKGGFGRTSFGERNDKPSFVDWIMPWIREGVDQALAAFGQNLPDEVKAGAEDTFNRVKELLGDFATV